jgi:hypothetical protein
MSDFEGLRIRPKNSEFSAGKNEFEGLRIRPKMPDYQNAGDDWLPFLSKKTASVLSELPDIPANLANLGEAGVRWVSGKLADNNNPYRDPETREALKHFSEQPNYFREDNVDRPSKWIKEGLANYDIDITPQPREALQRIVGHGMEWAAPGGLLGKFSKVNKVGKSAAIEGLLGSLSGTAIEAGVDPLVADISALGIQGGASKSRNLLDRFSKSGRNRAKEEKVAKLMKDITKGEGLTNLERFNPESLDVIPVTAEVALNRDISNLHNAYAPNFTGIQSKMTANDEILRRKLNNIGSESNPTQIEVGEAGREVISKKLGKLEKAREKAASPLYRKLEESPNLYPTENLNSYTEQAIAKELGDIEKGLNKNKSLLPDKYKRIAEKSKTELTELEKEVNKIMVQLEQQYPNLSFQAKDQILNELMPGFRGKISKISDLKEKIATLESGHYSPGHIDKAITEIGNNITELKRSVKGGNESLIRHFTKQKKALEADLEATPEGLAHRQVYKEHSPEINKINRDRLLKKFVSKDEWDAYRVPVDDLPRNIMASPKASIANYMEQVKGTPAEELTKAYFRDMYLGKAIDHNLPTYDKSSQFLRERGHKLDAIYSPEELGVFEQINEYLKNRAEVARGNSAFGSATMPKEQLKERVRSYLGSEVTQPLSLAKYIPGLPFKHNIAGFTRRNPTYNILEQALTDPVYARDLLTRKPVVYSKPNYLPTLYNILNGNQE